MPSARSAGLLSPIKGATNEDYGACQGYATLHYTHGGFPIRTGSFNQKVLHELIEANREAFGDEVAETLHLMINRVRDLDHDIATVLKLLTEVTKRDPRASLLRSIPGFGVMTTSRWCSVMEDVARFESPKQAMAFVGLVPNNKITGITRRRLLVVKHGGKEKCPSEETRCSDRFVS